MQQQPTTLRARLDNGLTVIIRESHRAPVASFWVWYRVGARNEVPGITGISHWVEHMLFKGTPTWKAGEIFRSVNKHGGTLNGFTWTDFTAYFETLPADKIGLGLDIESDRLQNAVFDPAEVESERTVILAEREGNENQPTFFLREEVNAAAFRAHPYGQGVIGFASDLRQITREDLYSHYRRYYVPNNATVVVVGDVEAAAMLAQIEERFGAIPAGQEIPVVRTIEPPQQGERRVTVRRPAPTATLLAAWHAPEAISTDAPAMIVLDAVLSGGKGIGYGGGGGMGRSSRLYRALVASGLASSAGSSFTLSIDPYLFSVSATLIPTTEPARVEQVMFDEIERLRNDYVPSDELGRAIKQLRAQVAYGLESVANQAYWLGSLQIVAPGVDPDEMLERIFAVEPEDVLRVAQTYLAPEGRTVGWLEPTGAAGGRLDLQPAAVRPHFFSDSERSAGSKAVPWLELRDRRLDSGLRLLGHVDPTSEASVVELRIPAGSARDSELPGIGRFTGQMLTRGTARRSFAELNEELDSIGAAIGVSCARDYVDVTAKCLKEDLGRLADLMAEVVLQPTFPEDELARLRDQALTALRQAENDTRSVADHALRTAIYPEGHPYRHRSLGTEESLRAIGQADLESFHRRWYRPNRAILAVAGGVPVEQAWAEIERAFAAWQPGQEDQQLRIPPVSPPERQVRLEERIPGKTQADIALGLPGIARNDPDYDALRLVNMILGRLGLMGRLGESVRERQGMAYYVYSSVSAGLGTGLWSAHAGVNPLNVEAALTSVLNEVERIREQPVSPDELADAKSYIIGSLPVGLETSDAIAATALDMAFYDLGLDYLERLPDRIGSLTAEQLQTAIRRIVLPDRFVIAVAAPEGETP